MALAVAAVIGNGHLERYFTCTPAERRDGSGALADEVRPMDETKKIRKTTFGWPVIVALIVLALVIAYFLFVGGSQP